MISLNGCNDRMIKQLKILLKDSLVYGVAEILNRSLQIFLLPLIFIYLSPTSFGVLDYFLTIKNVLSVVLGIGAITSLQRFSISKTKNEFKKLVFSTFVTVFVIDIILSLFLILFSSQITTSLIGESYVLEFILVILTSALFALRSVALGVLRLKRFATRFVIVSVLNFVIYLTITFIFIKHYQLDYLSFLYGGLIAISVSFFAGLYFVRSYISFSIDIRQCIDIIKFGLSVLSTSILVILISSWNRFFLKLNADFDEIALLGMASRLAVFVGAMLVAPFNLAWLPYLNNISDKPNFYELIKTIYRVFFAAGLTLSLAISLYSTNILDLTDDSGYHQSFLYVPFFALSFLFQGLYFIQSSGIYLSKLKQQYIYITMIVISFNLGLHLIFLNQSTVFIEAIVTMASYILMCFLAYIYGKKITRLFFVDLRMLLILLIFALSTFVMINYLSFDNLITELTLKALLVVLFFIGSIVLLFPIKLLLSKLRNRSVSF